MPNHPVPAADFTLHEAVVRGLRRSGYQALSDVQCEVMGGEVAISGVVPSFFLKQIAQTIILRMGQVVRLTNDLEVRSIVDVNPEFDVAELRVAG